MKMFTFFMTLVFVYSVAGAQTETRLIALSMYDGTGAHFIPADSDAYYYNDPLVQNIYSNADAYSYSKGAYDSDAIYLNTFNAQGLPDTFLTQEWSNYHQAYENINLVENYYDANNNDTSQPAQNWDSTTQKWVNYNKTTYAYDANGNLLMQTNYSWNSGWVPYSQYGNTYNSHNKEISLTLAYWTGSAWDTSSYGEYDRILYNYNALGEDTLTINVSYNYGTSSWDTSNRLLNIYHKNNTYDSIETVQNWVSALTWQNSDQYTFGYDASGNLTTFYARQPNGNAWQNFEQVISGYNTYNELTSEIINYWNSDSSFYEPTKSAYERFWYFDTYTGVEQLKVDNGQLAVYPNPSSNFIHTSVTLNKTTNLQLRLVNMLGQQVWSANEGNVSRFEGNISVANLRGGIYLLQMVTGGGTRTERVVVER